MIQPTGSGDDSGNTEASAAASESLLLTQPLKAADIRMIGTAVRRGWNIPDRLLDALPNEMVKLIRDGKPREKVAAAKVLVAMHQQNEANQPKAIAHAHAHVHRVEESPNAAPQTDTAATATAPAAADPAAHRRAALAARIARLR